MVENLAQPSLDETVEFRNFESSIQVALAKGFVVIATSACKKDQGKRTISGLFSKPHCNFRRIFEDYVTKGNGNLGGSNVNKRKQKERKTRKTSKENIYNVDCS
jgi:hypothetical protein